MCFGLTGVRFAIAEKWELAVATIILAGVLDGLDGRIARLLKGESRFGAELDSLSDVIAFGVSPAVVIYLWSLQYRAAIRLDDRARPRGVLRASPRALQRADRCDRAAAQGRRLPDRHPGTGRRGPAASADLSLAAPMAGFGDGFVLPAYVVAPWTARYRDS